MARHFLKSQKGESLIEVVAVLVIAVIIVTSLTIVALNGLNNAQYAKNQNLATQYAQEGMEFVRSTRNSANWSDFSTLANGDCYLLGTQSDFVITPTPIPIDPCPSPVSSDVNITAAPPAAANFIRRIQLQSNSGSCGSGNVQAAVSVYWTDSKCTSATNPYCHNVTLTSCFANINN